MPPEKRAAGTKSKSVPKRRRRIAWTLIKLCAATVVLAVLGTTAFIGTRCYSRTVTQGQRPPAAADGVPGYVRAEAFTYLTLPEWFIVYSADEYAAHLAHRPPSAFPYVGSVRQYWSYYGSVCGVTKRAYPFETDYHVMLGIIGVSFTLENTVKAIYENTIGRLTELVSSADTPEDAFARRTAVEYGTFMHTTPWYEFPFGSRLVTLWRDTPLRGSNTLRKIERRVVLTVEYGGKAVYGWLIAKASGAAYAAEDQRIHARVDNATDAIFKDTRVTQVRKPGPGAYIVALPRYEAFTKTALALNGLGVRFIDIAGNDQILITVLARRGMSDNIPDATLVASKPILTDPTMQRLAFSVPVASLREIGAHLARERAVIEHLYDY